MTGYLPIAGNAPKGYDSRFEPLEATFVDTGGTFAKTHMHQLPELRMCS